MTGSQGQTIAPLAWSCCQYKFFAVDKRGTENPGCNGDVLRFGMGNSVKKMHVLVLQISLK